MSPVTHFLGSWILGDAATREPRDRALVSWCGVLPDADGLGAAVDLANRFLGQESWHYAALHHRLFHGLPAALAIPALLACFAVRKGRTFAIGIGAVHLHLLCDLVGSRGPGPGDIWPVFYLAPLSDRGVVTWSGQWALNGWPNVVLTLVLLGWILARAVRSGYSPVGVFSQSADRRVVAALRNRWRRTV